MEQWIKLRFTLNQALTMVDAGLADHLGPDPSRMMRLAPEDCQAILNRIHRVGRTNMSIRRKVASALSAWECATGLRCRICRESPATINGLCEFCAVAKAACRDQREAEETWPCNDCGAPCPKHDDLCSACYEKQLRADEWDLLHPEARCPPRE